MTAFRRLRSIGPVEIATGVNRRTNKRGYLASCTANGCGWSATFDTEDGAALAAGHHKCAAR